MAPPEIIVHHLQTSRSERIFWVLEELQLPYTVKVYYRTPTMSAPDDLRKVHPFGRAPVVSIDGKLYAESGPIVHKLLSLAAPGRDNVEAETSEDSLFWSHFSEGSLMTLLQASTQVAISSKLWSTGQVGGLSEEGQKGVAAYSAWVTQGLFGKQSQVHFDEIESFLSSHPGKFFSGGDKPGEGDFMLFFPIRSVIEGRRKGIFNIGPATRKWLDTVKARPSAQNALQRLEQEEEGQKQKSNL